MDTPINYSEVKFKMVMSQTPTLLKSYSVVGRIDGANVCFINGDYCRLFEDETSFRKPATMYKFQALKIVKQLNDFIEKLNERYKDDKSFFIYYNNMSDFVLSKVK